MLVKNKTQSEYQRFLNKYAQGHTDETVRMVHVCLARSIRDALYDGYLKKTLPMTLVSKALRN